MFDKITPGKLLKAATIGVGVCGAALIAPIGLPAVIALTAAGAASSWAADSVGDAVKEGEKGEEKKDN